MWKDSDEKAIAWSLKPAGKSIPHVGNMSAIPE